MSLPEFYAIDLNVVFPQGLFLTLHNMNIECHTLKKCKQLYKETPIYLVCLISVKLPFSKLFKLI